MTTIRPRIESDVKLAAAVLVAVHRADGYPVEGVNAPEKWLQPAGLIAAWVAEDDGHVVGHVALTSPQTGDAAVHLWQRQAPHTDRIAVLGRLFVSPDTRGRSIGEQLVSSVMEFAARSHLTLLLDVMKKDRAAIRLYERLGWQFIGNAHHPNGNGEDVPARCYVFTSATTGKS